MSNPVTLTAGQLISFDGIDSSGKETQASLLRDKFIELGISVIKIATPDYTTASGKHLKRLFQGHDGGWDNLAWQEQMRLIADNRAEHRPEVIQTLEQGGIVIYDRYVPSSVAHMTVTASRTGAPESSAEVADTVKKYEYQINQMPSENLSIFLDVPPTTANDLLEQRKVEQGETDEQTDELSLQQAIYKQYLSFTSEPNDHFIRVSCTSDGQLKKPSEIHVSVWQAVSSRIPQSLV